MDTVNKYRYESSCRWPPSENVIDDCQQEKIYETCFPAFSEVLKQERLDDEVSEYLKGIYLPLAAWLAKKHNDKPIVIGINGAQGSGKSTLSNILKSILLTAFKKSVVHISIDDLYLSRKAREQLSSEVHPLLKVRGVPGTHNVALGKKIFNELLNGSDDTLVQIPSFNKAEDDLHQSERWTTVKGAPDIILFEGWCVGSQNQHESELLEAINQFEDEEDVDGSWRSYVNQQLAGSYQSLFGHIDYLLMLKVPDMESVYEWRSLQEKKLAATYAQQGISARQLMTEKEIARFIMHCERITRATLNEMPSRADVLLELDKNHQVCNVKIKVPA